MQNTLSRRRVLIRTAAAATLPLFALHARAQAWPNKPIRVVVGYPAGGQSDVFARLYGEYVQQQTGQQWVVENKSGAGGSIAAGEVKRAAPDGRCRTTPSATSRWCRSCRRAACRWWPPPKPAPPT